MGSICKLSSSDRSTDVLGGLSLGPSRRRHSIVVLAVGFRSLSCWKVSCQPSLMSHALCSRFLDSSFLQLRPPCQCRWHHHGWWCLMFGFLPKEFNFVSEDHWIILLMLFYKSCLANCRLSLLFNHSNTWSSSWKVLTSLPKTDGLLGTSLNKELSSYPIQRSSKATARLGTLWALELVAYFWHLWCLSSHNLIMDVYKEPFSGFCPNS